MPKKERWPVFGVYVRSGNLKGKYFRLKSRRIFVDFPNLEISHFLQDIHNADVQSDNVGVFYTKAIKIISEHNSGIEHYLNWVLDAEKPKKTKTRYITFYMDKHIYKDQYGLGYKISSYKNIKNFVVSLVNSERPISVKYFYLFRSRRALPKWLYSESGIKNFKRELMPALKNLKYNQNVIFAELDETSKVLNSLVRKLKKETIEGEPFLAPAEVILNASSSLLPSIRELIKAGQVTSVYIILRKVIEDISMALSWRKLTNHKQKDIYHDLYYNEFLILKEKGLEGFEEFGPERKIDETKTNREIGKRLAPSLRTLYVAYSFFVHVNLTALQVLPFSSVIEFGILKEQLKQFNKAVKSTIKLAIRT